MNTKVLVAAALAAVALLLLTRVPSEKGTPMITFDQAETHQAFITWMEKYGKKYQEEERVFRYKRFAANYAMIRLHNERFARGEETCDLETNAFADLDRAEFKARYLGLKRTKTVTTECTGKVAPVTNPPASIDWSTKGAVTPIKNQGQCGSCWAFSTTGSLEGLAKIEKGTLLSLSEQQLVDCAGGDYGNEGCNGGFMDTAMMYVIDNGITDEASYPYTARDQKCAYKESMEVYRIRNCADVTANQTAALMEAVVNQPVAIAVEADELSFQFYRTGVLTSRCGTDLDHGVLAVGYGNLNGIDYWKVKNSWGSGWGSQGYIYIGRGGDGPGVCGILMENNVPLESV